MLQGDYIHDSCEAGGCGVHSLHRMNNKDRSLGILPLFLYNELSSVVGDTLLGSNIVHTWYVEFSVCVVWSEVDHISYRLILKAG